MGALTLGDIGSVARFLYSLVSTLSRPIRLAEARASLRERLAGREQSFLSVLDAAVYPLACGLADGTGLSRGG
jgi:hypothetical protein